MKRLPTILTGLFLAITLARVANLVASQMGAGILGWLYAIGLGVAVYVAGYWTRVQVTRKIAITSLVVFVVIDGFFNLVEVLRSTYPDRAEVKFMIAVAMWVYGLFPTAAAALLGWLQGYVNKLPPSTKKPAGFALILERLVQRVLAWLEQPVPKKTPAVETAKAAKVCVQCSWTSAEAEAQGRDPKRAYAAHTKVHVTARKNGHSKKEKIAL